MANGEMNNTSATIEALHLFVGVCLYLRAYLTTENKPSLLFGPITSATSVRVLSMGYSESMNGIMYG